MQMHLLQHFRKFSYVYDRVHSRIRTTRLHASPSSHGRQRVGGLLASYMNIARVRPVFVERIHV